MESVISLLESKGEAKKGRDSVAGKEKTFAAAEPTQGKQHLQRMPKLSNKGQVSKWCLTPAAWAFSMKLEPLADVAGSRAGLLLAGAQKTPKAGKPKQWDHNN